ncbi:hypothetical protein PMAYCL1PPCAC_27468, partial [Pristionchus mayeri]
SFQMLTLRESLVAMATVAAYFVACSFFTFAHDFFLYNFAYYFNKIFCHGKPPILFEINCFRIGILMGWIHAEIKQARQGGRNVRKEVHDLARGMKTRSHTPSLCDSCKAEFIPELEEIIAIGERTLELCRPPSLHGPTNARSMYIY